MNSKWKLVLPIAVALFLSLSVPAVALGQTTTASRDIAEQTLTPGATTQVTVTIDVAEAEALALDENPPDGWTLTRVSEDPAASAFNANTNEWVWFQAVVGTITVVYDLTAPADAAGPYTITGTIGGEDWSDAVGGETVLMAAPEQVELESGGSVAKAAFATSDLSISPSEADIGEAVTIGLMVANTGNAAGSYEVTLKIDGAVEATKEVTLNAGASKEVTFTTAKDVAGSYSVIVNGLGGSFSVREGPGLPPLPPEKAVPEDAPSAKPPINWPVVGGVIAGVIVVGLLIFFLVRRRAI